jgi:hypothetical protein
MPEKIHAGGFGYRLLLSFADRRRRSAVLKRRFVVAPRFDLAEDYDFTVFRYYIYLAAPRIIISLYYAVSLRYEQIGSRLFAEKAFGSVIGHFLPSMNFKNVFL